MVDQYSVARLWHSAGTASQLAIPGRNRTRQICSSGTGNTDLADVALNRLKGTLAIQADPPAALLIIRGPEFTLTLTNSFGTVESVPTDQYVVEARYRHWQGRQEISVTHNTISNYTFAPQIGVLQLTCNQPNTSFELYGPDNDLVERGVLPSMIDGLPNREVYGDRFQSSK